MTNTFNVLRLWATFLLMAPSKLNFSKPNLQKINTHAIACPWALMAVSYKLASDVKFLSYFNTVLLLFLIHYCYVHYDDQVLFQIPPFPMVKSCKVECKNLQFVEPAICRFTICEIVYFRSLFFAIND